MKTTPKNAENAAIEIIRKLRAHGHVALLAGGCVRDRLLGREPKDFDVVTDATPARVEKVFPKSRGVGAKFGVMLVRRGGVDVEVATFRSDGSYSDGRRPDEVRFGSEREDALRRDFTINGMFFDPVEDKVIDYVSGQEDLKAGIIRTIGDPQERFAEDHLRLLRAVRFAARLGFTIEGQTFGAIGDLAENLSTVSAERVWMELEMTLCDVSRATGWSLLIETGLRSHLCSDWPADDKEDQLARKRLEALPSENVDAALALACVLRSQDKGPAARICRSLRLSNRLSGTLVWLLKSMGSVKEAESLELADMKFLMANDAWPLLLEFLRVDLIALEQDPRAYEAAKRRASKIPPDQVAPAPFVSGDDLCDMGMTPGPQLGQILDTIYRDQLNGSITNREEALKKARELTPS